MVSKSSSTMTISYLNSFYGGYVSYGMTDRLNLSAGVDFHKQSFAYERPRICYLDTTSSDWSNSFIPYSIVIPPWLLEKDPYVCEPREYAKVGISVARFPVIASLNLSKDLSGKTIQTYLALGYAYGRVLSFDKNIYEDYQYDLPLRRNLHYGIVGLEFKTWFSNEMIVSTCAYVEFTRLDYYLFGRVYNYSLGFRLGF